MARQTRSLTLPKLQEIAARCGVNKSGTQGSLVSRLVDAVRERDGKPLGPAARILSIDLGIRNLAYAVLSPGKNNARSGLQPSLPTIHAWKRLCLTSTSDSVTTPLDLDTQETSKANKAEKEEFTPLSISKIAAKLVEDHLLPLNPSHILIERQRFRSGSSPAVYEWTVRVNTLEAMLYAIFSTLQSLGRWDGVLLPVDPRHVGAFLLESRQGGEMSARRSAATTKKDKINLLGSWLLEESTIELASNEAQTTSQAFLQRWRGAGTRKMDERRPLEAVGVEDVTGSSGGLKKLDDITDSLLQGVAWLRWQANTSQLAKSDEYRILLEMEAKRREKHGKDKDTV